MENRNLANAVYEKILNEIVEVRLKPGTYVLERDVSQRLGISRTPVREAIKRLVQEGWLIGEERRRPAVKGFSLAEGKAIFDFRWMAESFAIQWIYQNNLTRVLAGQLDFQLRKMLELAGEDIPFIRADIKFHSIMIDMLENEYLARAWATVAEAIIRLSIYSMDYARTVERITGEHDAILQSLWNTNREESLKLLKAHHNGIMAGLERQLALEYEAGRGVRKSTGGDAAVRFVGAAES